MKLKVLSSALSLVVLCSAPLANAGSSVVGQLVANPIAVINAGQAQQKVGSQATPYIEGDMITTEENSNAKISLTSGLANVVIAPNTVMSVEDASETNFSLVEGAFSIEAKLGQIVSVETSAGTYEISSDTPVNAIATFEGGKFAAISKGGLLNVQAPDGVVTPVEAGAAIVFNEKGATSIDVQLAGGDVHEHQNEDGAYTSHAHDDGLIDHDHASGYFTLNNALIAGGLIAATALLSGSFSDGSDGDDTTAASPAQ